ncbi:hypothetical protein A6R68_16844 [Neotoma lepida]|uniref:SCAN box domain-containing protein n=1 Tax=Neotoma lepida TaxID=56216 RepID=A0A1A6HFI0_NEOLE|nr:hypothetical protein A6R68_16844 [Neotoma lepida]
MATNIPPDSLPSEQPPPPPSEETGAEKQDYDREVWHLKFRTFSPSESSDPIEDLKRISELCYQWLRPDLSNKEEILDQLVLEQFMISMPPELQALVKESGVESCKELEKMLRDGRKPRHWSVIAHGQTSLPRGSGFEKAKAKADVWGDDGVVLSEESLSSGEVLERWLSG